MFQWLHKAAFLIETVTRVAMRLRESGKILEDNKQMQQVVQDVVVAKRLFTKLQLRFAKLLNKYCVFD